MLRFCLSSYASLNGTFPDPSPHYFARYYNSSLIVRYDNIMTMQINLNIYQGGEKIDECGSRDPNTDLTVKALRSFVYSPRGETIP
jgi:hypothetical protein